MTAEALISQRSRDRIFTHFACRLKSRFGIEGVALKLWRHLAMLHHRQDWAQLVPVVRLNSTGRRLFFVRLADGRPMWVVFDTRLGVPITVYCAGMDIQPQGFEPILLTDPAHA
ncbi:hypothetical protein ACSQ76_12390 [Roseovarius sp. B08]|uniref:hypothetical protein n=1 Tax=Roseovarius sp. B08 TaxID=3449223 RepID=UPI003EDBE8ED